MGGALHSINMGRSAKVAKRPTRKEKVASKTARAAAKTVPPSPPPSPPKRGKEEIRSKSAKKRKMLRAKVDKVRARLGPPLLC